MSAHIGVTGLAVMGANLARNLARNGFTVALHNRSVEKTDALLEKHARTATSSARKPCRNSSTPSKSPAASSSWSRQALPLTT